MNNFAEVDFQLKTFLKEDIDDTHYFPGVFAYEWTRRAEPQLVHCDRLREYEDNLINFLSHGSIMDKNDVIVIVGGTGTGKSTAIKYVSSNSLISPRTCKKKVPPVCHFETKKIIIDFQYLDRSHNEAITLDEFWTYVAAQVHNSVDDTIEVSSNLPSFFAWCLTQSKFLCHSILIQSFVIEIQEACRAYVNGQPFISYRGSNLLEYIVNRRKDLFKSCKPHDFAWYNLLLMGYNLLLSEPEKCHCPFLFIDNIDHLPPTFQRLAVDHGILLADLFKAKTLITIRPLTWAQAVHGQYLVEQKNHYAPDSIKVIVSRLQNIEQKCDDTFVKIVFKRMSALISNDTNLQTMIRATSGISIRYALRNVHNMLQSPIFRGYVSSGHEKSDRISVTELGKAYFFGENHILLDHAYDDIYSIRGSHNENTMLIKIRILDYIGRINKGVSKVRDIFSFCSKFEYEFIDIKSAINELMLRSRALLWSAEGWSINDETSYAEVMITPIGRNYYEDLFGELFYIEVCLARNVRDTVAISQVTQFDRDINNQDCDEIKKFVNQHGSSQYERLYGDIGCVSLKHSLKLKQGIDLVKPRYMGTIEFDEMREVYIKRILSGILNTK